MINFEEALTLRSTDQGIEKLKREKVSKYFTWEEVFVNRSEEEIKSTTDKILKNAIEHALKMDIVRDYLGAPITVTSWYRSPSSNIRAGGAPKSIHMIGKATDFVIKALKPSEVQKRLLDLYIKEEFVLEITNGNWTHVDTRGYAGVIERIGTHYLSYAPDDIASLKKRKKW